MSINSFDDALRALGTLAASNSISRRRFLERASALGVAVATASTIWSDNAYAARKGGHFRLAMGDGGANESLDPRLIASSMNVAVSITYNTFLTQQGAAGGLVPDLAKSWEGSDGSKKWVFELRNDASFHNGKGITADDVVASIGIHLGEDSPSSAKAILGSIDELKTDGPYTVAVTLKEGNADFPAFFTDSRVPILPSTETGVDWESGIGGGAFLLDSFEPGIAAKFTRNPNDWHDTQPFFDSAELILVTDPSARVQALRSGSVDAATKIDPKVAKLVDKEPNLRIEAQTSAFHYTFPMFTDVAPFDDNNVRLALKNAFNREDFVERVLGGYGQVANDHPVSPAHEFYAGDIEQRAFDPEKSKFFLNKAGLDSLRVSLSTSAGLYAGAVDAAVLFGEGAKKAGIEIEIVNEAADGYWSNVWLKKPFTACYWSGRPTADWILSDAYSEKSPYNDAHLQHERFNRLLVEARAELDYAKRSEMYREIQIILRDEGGTIVPAFGQYVNGMSEKVAHKPDVAARYEMDDYRALQRWWFTS